MRLALKVLALYSTRFQVTLDKILLMSVSPWDDRLRAVWILNLQSYSLFYLFFGEVNKYQNS